MLKSIDFNTDMGESFGNYQYGEDEKILPLITSANLACGFHGGDPVVMANTVRQAKKYGIQVGAHPGFPDLMGFGRRYMSAAPAEIYSYVLYQLGALYAFLKTEGMSLSHVKLHGALYMMALTDPQISEAVSEAVYKFDPTLPIYSIAETEMEKAAEKIGLTMIPEYFADRPYTQDGVKMFGWTQEEIGNSHEIANRVLELVQTGFITGIDGNKIPIDAKTVCVHSDTPNAGEIVKTMRQTLEDHGIMLHVPHK